MKIWLQSGGTKLQQGIAAGRQINQRPSSLPHNRKHVNCRRESAGILCHNPFRNGGLYEEDLQD